MPPVLLADPAAGARVLQAGIDTLLAHSPDLTVVVPGGAALGWFAARLHMPHGIARIDSIAAGRRWLATEGEGS